ncbi:hypothetical protein CWC28_21535, partial [Pseudoalteromonas sp. S4492]
TGSLLFPPPNAQKAIVRNGITSSGNTSIIFLFLRKTCDLCTLLIHFIFVFVINKFFPAPAHYPSNPAGLAECCRIHSFCSILNYPYIF